MAALYGSKALRGYAQEQVQRADIYLAKHAEASLSLCRCGRLHPCDDRRYWAWVRAHYAPLAQMPEAPDPAR